MIAATARSAALAFALAILLVPLIWRLCIRWRLFDLPGPLKIHKQPIPRLGGIAIAFAFCGAILMSGGFAGIRAWHFFTALALVWIVGLADDLRGLSPLNRLAVQTLAGMILWHGGWRVPLAGHTFLSFCVTSAFLVFTINAFNFLDGADGVAAGVTSLIAFAYGVATSGLGSHFGDVVAWSLLGACTGFVIYNLPPAQIFMGDSGSTVLGFGVAFLGLDFYGSSPSPSSLTFPFVIAGLPLLDAGFAVVRRLRGRGSPFYGDCCHLTDLLANRGLSSRRIVYACYATTAMLATVGSAVLHCKAIYFFLGSAVSLGSVAAALVRLGALRGNGGANTNAASGSPGQVEINLAGN